MKESNDPRRYSRIMIVDHRSLLSNQKPVNYCNSNPENCKTAA